MMSHTRRWHVARVSAAAVMIAGSVIAARATTVQTSNGPVTGTVSGGIEAFLGIPYAAPPVGGLRWMPPQPHPAWSTPIQANRFGDTCPQNNTIGYFAKPSVTEDCLYLNVYTEQAAPAAKPKPVMVWIHGGGLLDGESNDYDGSKLVKYGDTLVVTFNYRVGVLGFFAAPQIDSESHALANYGLMDQQFALQWVKANIAAFGGDPGNVTIFGESAGGNAVYMNLASPLSAGLFHKGIVESGGYEPAVPTLATAEDAGSAFAAAEGCITAACLRALSVPDILALQAAYLVGDIVDGKVLPSSLDKAFSTGAFNWVPVITGTNRDEGTLFAALQEDPYGLGLNGGQYAAALASAYGTNAQTVAQHYPLSAYANPSEAFGAEETSSLFACAGFQFYGWLPRYVPTYVYEFADRKAPNYAPSAGFDEKAAHTFELQYLFPHFHGGLGKSRPLDPAQRVLSDQMVGYWSNFAHTGNPNGAGSGAAYWPLYDPAKSNILSLRTGRSILIHDFYNEHDCAFWATLQTY